MLADFLIDVLMIRQSRYISEDVINIQNISYESGLVKWWKPFLMEVVKPGDYIFDFDLRETLTEHMSKYSASVVDMQGELDDFNNLIRSARKDMFNQTQLVLRKPDDVFTKRWANIGVYTGGIKAWEHYIYNLAFSLDAASHIRSYLCSGAVCPIDTGNRYGAELNKICSVVDVWL